MTDAAWTEADEARNFSMVTPMDTSKSIVQTAVRMSYDRENLYLLAICYKKLQGKYIVESMRRDFIFGKNDNFLVFMDTFEDQTNGFSFGANAAGAQWDGTMYDGGKVDLNWDNKWMSAVKNYPDKWVLEAAIPFKSIRYKKGITTWGINFSRLDVRVAEKSSWAPVPRQFPTAALAYTGTLLWDEPPPAPGRNISIIPYLLASTQKNYEKNSPADYSGQFGGDAKIVLKSSLNLDLTVNPDFSQVEVDRQVTNLDRFELFFPERRQFFLENGDQFSNFGYPTIRPFFSRRIGLDAPILFGARLSGKLNKDWRTGIMNMQTGRVDSVNMPAQNFTVLALQRKVFSRSNFGFLFINKQAVITDQTPDSSKTGKPSYNRNFGFEYNLASKNNLWLGKAILMKSFSPQSSGNEWVHAANLQFSSRKWLLSWQHEYIGSGYRAEVGYVPRVGYFKVNPVAGMLLFPASGKVLSHGPRFSTALYFDEKWNKTDNETNLTWGVNFRDQSVFNALIAYNYVRLLKPFDPTNSGKDTLATGSEHDAKTIGIDYVSKPQSLFTYAFSTRVGGYYQDGKRFFFSVDLGYRIQPYFSVTVSTSYNDIRMEAPWNRTVFWLVGPRIDLTLTNSLFFTAFLQYNQQANNINLNTRFQWRYRPASDIYLVYTDNYYPSPFNVRNRALVLKFNYWWNL
jgi:hypothetical protein